MPEAVIPCSVGRSPEGVDNAEAGLLEIDAVSRDDRQTVNQSRSGDETVFDGHSAPRGAKTCEQLRPPQARLRLPRQTAKPLDTRVEPSLEAGTPPSVAQQKIPKRSSPRIMGSTAISRSLSRSHSTTLALGSFLVGSLRTLASTRYLTTRRSIPTRQERKSPSRDRRAANRPRLHSARANVV